MSSEDQESNTEDPNGADTAPVPATTTNDDMGASDIMGAGKSNVNLIYILYLASIVVGITAIVGVVVAYMNRGKGPAWLDSHYTFQIHTFWKGFLLGIVGMITIPLLGLGVLLLLALLVWYIIRCVKGMGYLSNNQTHPGPEGWMLG